MKNISVWMNVLTIQWWDSVFVNDSDLVLELSVCLIWRSHRAGSQADFALDLNQLNLRGHRFHLVISPACNVENTYVL